MPESKVTPTIQSQPFAKENESAATPRAEPASNSTLTEAEVAEYLEQHPKFFDAHEELFAQMDLSKQLGEVAATPFHERQVEALRARGNSQQERVNQLVDTAQNNQDLTNELHHVAIALLGQEATDNNTPNLAALAGVVKSRFSMDEVTVCIAAKPKATPKVDYDMLQQRVSHLSSICDDRVSTRLSRALFPSNEAIASCAFVPLVHQKKLLGVMVLGSTDAQRFQPGMGVLFLDRLGQLLGAYIAVCDFA